MANITLKGNPIQTAGELPALNTQAPNFDLVANDLSHKSLNDYSGKRIILNIFPSLDTGTCAASVRNFNKLAAELDNTVVLCISRDLPFAQARFCGAEGLENVFTLSDFVSGQFGKDYGLLFANGPLKDLDSRCVLVLDQTHKVIYSEQVSEIVNEPNYEAAIAVLS